MRRRESRAEQTDLADTNVDLVFVLLSLVADETK